MHATTAPSTTSRTRRSATVTSGGHVLPSIGGHLTEPARTTPVRWKSTFTKGGTVPFPPFVGERLYMRPFLKFKDKIALFGGPSMERWLPTVTAMMQGIETTQTCFLMVDQSVVPRGKPHRRAGRHIDGNWVEEKGSKETRKLGRSLDLILLASDVQGCAAWSGLYNARKIGKGGDCEGVGVARLERTLLDPGVVYHLNAATIHESIPLPKGGQRTLVRINVPKGAKLVSE